ncbi:uncharacterized protein ATNIH1004_011400 [Aspergillus tanneri]|uniref:Uncharacterized protein n=1 Tax=Aspergillus tanneri TaxID=1220188 RepID=A0A5M9M9Y1_9EURO|nr:uncharacterized protein ATNIH1004_011400 [Aspergillus tanneri]KAA8642456.1 hypothetical protein ATNIH1004_011400 [Aspergillus tanneri]
MVSAYVDNFQWPPFFQVYVKAVGDTGVNVGAFVLGIVKKPEITLSGRTVQGTLGFNTMDEMMLNLAESMFLGWGRELNLILQYLEMTGGRGWMPSGKDSSLIIAKDIGLDVGTELESWKENMVKKNWKYVLDIKQWVL